MIDSTLEFRKLRSELQQPLQDYFEILASSGDTHFHPHPFTPDEAMKLAHYNGKDLYYVLLDGETILGYGMLRGWDEGYAIPSLGISIHPDARGLGLGKAFMLFLHCAARRRGASTIRLKVYPENDVAKKLYDSLGYAFEDEAEGQLLGYLNL